MQGRLRVFYIGELMLCWLICTLVLTSIRLYLIDDVAMDPKFVGVPSEVGLLYAWAYCLGMAWTTLYFGFEWNRELAYLQSLSVICHLTASAGVVALGPLLAEGSKAYRAFSHAGGVSAWPSDDFEKLFFASVQCFRTVVFGHTLVLATVLYAVLVVATRKNQIDLARARKARWFI